MSTLTEAVRLYSVTAAAELLDMSSRWVYLQIKAGVIPVVEFGSTRPKQRIRADHLQSFIDSRTFDKRIT